MQRVAVQAILNCTNTTHVINLLSLMQNFYQRAIYYESITEIGVWSEISSAYQVPHLQYHRTILHQ